ncbi:MAG: YegS/Rv2252/BmrU family lipid kinase [Prevotella sp.]|nr:YegS/Rv2252/BmrU family lipid kinase [Prevotella sp.]
MDKRRIVFVINPTSGTTNKDVMPQLIDKYIDSDSNDVSTVFTEYAGHASEIASKCVNEGVDVVVAVGGDGTVNEVARALAESDTTLGIVPCGSGNGLARHLMLPMNVKGALEIINNGLVHSLDYGIIDGHPFFCTCGMGFDAFISKKFASAGKRGPLTYIENVLKEGLKYEPETYELTLDGNETEPYKAFLISVANASQYGNDAYIAPQASMSDGFLDVVIMEPFDILEAPQVGIDLMNKTLNKSSKIKCFKAKDIRIRRKEEGAIHYDGDPIDAGKDIHIQLRPHAIKMIVNPIADKKRRQPNVVQSAFSQFFNDINTVRNEVVDGIANPVRQVKTINSYIQSKLS